VVALFVVVGLGPALIGLQVFHGADLMLSYPPFRALAPTGFVPDNRCVGDTVDSLLPAAAEVRRRLLAGDLAEWSPWSSGGSPLASVPNFATWSPLSLPYLLLPTWLAPAFVKLLEIAVSVAGMVLLVRRLGGSTAAGLLGGLLFTSSGFMVTWTNWPHPLVAAWIPLLFWALEGVAQRPSLRSAAPVAGVVAAMLLGGFPAVTGYGLYAGACYLVVRLLVLRARAPHLVVGGGLVALAGVALGAALVAIQLLPFLAEVSELNLESRAQNPQIHLPGSTLASLAVPEAIGSCPDRFGIGRGHPVESNTFFGAAGLVLVAAALIRRPGPGFALGARGFFAAASLVVLVLGWYGGTPLALAQELPVFDTNPVFRIRSVLGFFLAVLAAIGYDALVRSRGRGAGGTRLLASGLAWLAFVAAAALAVVRLVTNLAGGGKLYLVDDQVVLAVVSGALCLLAVLLAARHSPARRAALGLIPVLVLVESLAFALPYWPTTDRDQFFPTTPTHTYLADHLGHDRFAGTDQTMLPSTNAYYRLRSLEGHRFTDPRYGELLRTVDTKAFRSATYTSIRPAPEVVRSPLLDRLGVRYVVNAPSAPVYGVPREVGQAAGQVELQPGQPVTVPVRSDGLRAVTLRVPEPVRVTGAFSRVRLEVLDPAGKVVTSTEQRLPGRVPPGEKAVLLDELPATMEAGGFVLPVAAEQADVAAVRLTLLDSRIPLPVQATSDGLPTLALTLPDDDGLRLEATGGASVWRRLNALPRIRWASSARVVPDQLARLTALANEPADPAKPVLFSDPGAVRADGRPATVEVTEDAGDAVAATVDAQGAGYLVVADALQDDWIATVDGEPVELRDADHALVAVPVPAGRHTVRLEYTPPGTWAGAGISAVSVVVVAALAGVRRVPGLGGSGRGLGLGRSGVGGPGRSGVRGLGRPRAPARRAPGPPMPGGTLLADGRRPDRRAPSAADTGAPPS